MGGVFHSVLTLGLAFGGVVAATLALAIIVIPSGTSVPSFPDDSGDGRASPPAVGGDPAAPVSSPGGVLRVSGDREGALSLRREAYEAGRYALSGDAGRVLFDSNPLSLARIQYEGLEFFLDADACDIVPGQRHEPQGVADAGIRCEDVRDVRDNGTFTFEGTLGIAADLLGMRGGIPDSGGTVVVGDQSVEFAAARVFIGAQGTVIGRGYVLAIHSADGQGIVAFDYDPDSHELRPAYVQVDDRRSAELTSRDCALDRRELGRLNPHTVVLELAIGCDAVDVGEMGVVSVSGSLVVEQSELR